MAKTLRVLIVGSDIGGLSTAIAIRLAGREVAVLEAEDEITEVGAGEVSQGGLIIGANGLNSICREKLVLDDEEPRFTGNITFRVLLNLEGLLPDDPDFLEMTTKPQCTYWLGPSHHAIVYSLRGGTQINLVAVAPDDMPPGVIRAPCAYSTLPYLSQGAGITLEGAAVLGQLLTESIALSEILAKYEAIRRPRTTGVVKASSQQQHWYNLHNGEEQRERDRTMGAKVPQEGDPFLWKDPAFAP
ncbi:hypothetical protein BDZ45DRAFT_731307 [Acephala macrosclerotiorum]|nr:hypothetical protein BDZ45DRAFT_731307 [Acephala macrosclerotiorum]